jgi:hypothetical protein
MARMTRTQISLEERQHRFLRSEAARRAISVSALVRELIDREMILHRAGGPDILSVAGMFSDGTGAGENHDRILQDDLFRRKTESGP